MSASARARSLYRALFRASGEFPTVRVGASEATRVGGWRRILHRVDARRREEGEGGGARAKTDDGCDDDAFVRRRRIERRTCERRYAPSTRRTRRSRARRRRRRCELAAAQVDNVEATAKHLTKVFADERVHARV